MEKNDIKKYIEEKYTYYINNVSKKNHAASLEMCLFLYKLLEDKKPHNILDMGSGLTSFICRLYQKKNKNVNTYSLDDNISWLNKTKEFLLSNELSVENLYHKDNIDNLKNTKFDLIIYDYGNIETRIKNIDLPFSLLSDDGIILFDDMHWGETMGKWMNPTLNKTIKDSVKKYNFILIDTKKETIDEYGRYSCLATKQK